MSSEISGPGVSPSAADISRVGIVGLGAMGAMYLVHFVDAGFPVVVAARGERARRLASGPITVNGRSFPVYVVDADEPEHATPVDLAIVAVKNHQLADAVDDLAAIVGPNTIVLSVLNGLDSESVIEARLRAVTADGTGGVLPCVALGMDAERTDDGFRFQETGKLVFGEATTSAVTPRVRAVQTALDRAGLVWDTPADISRELWWKFMVNVGINQAQAVLRAPYGDFKDDGVPRQLMMALMDEVIAVARAEGVVLGAEDLTRWDQVLVTLPGDSRTSMLQDVEAGRATEVDVFAGQVVELGHRHGIPTPYNQMAYWILDRMGAP